MTAHQDTAPPEALAGIAGLVVIPAFNEEDSIAEVVRSIILASGFPVLVVSDHSSDDTVAQARSAGAEVITLPVQLGPWGATQTGLRYASQRGYDVVLSMDADGQHLASDIAAVVRPLAEGTADVAIGACTERGSALRKFAWVMLRWTSSLRLDDITSGFRAYGRAAVECLANEEATLLAYPDVGVLLLLQSRGLRVVDVPVTMRERHSGASRVFSSWFTVMFYMLQTLLLGLSKRPLQRFTPKQPRQGAQRKGDN